VLFSEILHRVVLVRTDFSEERIVTIIRVTGIAELGATLIITIVFLPSLLQLLVRGNVVPSSTILVSLMTEAILSSETSVLTSATLHHIAEDFIFHSNLRVNLNSYTDATALSGPIS
jgi:hypothetical protein